MTALEPTAPGELASPDALAAFDQAAREHVRDDRPANTGRAYADDWKVWTRYCTTYGLPTSAGTVGTLVGFVEWMTEQGYAATTIDRRVTGVRAGLRADGIELTRRDAEVVRDAINNCRRRAAKSGPRRGRGKAQAIEIRHLRDIADLLPDTPIGHRDRALLLVGFGLGARRSELSEMRAADITLCPDGLCVQLRWAKTGEVEDTAIGFGTHHSTCPVRAWQTWQATADLTPEGPAFRQVTKHGRVLDKPISGHSIAAVIAKRAAEAGVPVRMTGHSLRSGMATEAYRAGHDAHTIAQQGRWSPTSRNVHDYIRNRQKWTDNALVGIGL